MMNKEGMILPPGYRFKPLDHELINLYLKPRVMRQKLPCPIINDDIQVYSPDSTPWILFDLDDHDSWIDSITNAEKTRYVFTTLSKLATVPNTTTTRIRSNTCKKAGCGAWVQRTKRVPILDRDGNVIGGKRMLNFEIHDTHAGFNLDKAVYFKMHEYSLWGVNESLGSDVVLCEITFDPSKEPFCKLATKKVSRRGRKPQNKKQKNKNLVGSTTLESESLPVMSGNVYQQSTSLHPESLVPLDGGVGNVYQESTSLHPESLVPLDGGVGNVYQESTSLHPESLVPLDGGVGNVYQESTSLHPESLVPLDGGVGNVYQESTSLHPESLVPLDGGVGNAEFGGDLCSDGQGAEGLCSGDISDEDLIHSFTMSELLELMKSDPLMEPLEDTTIGGLGKRKSAEEDGSCQAKKMCFS